MKKSLGILFLVGLIISLAACSSPLKNKNNPSPQSTPAPVQEAPAQQAAPPSCKEYFPITAGSNWSYLGSGNEYASFSREVLFSSGSRAQFKEFNGGTTSASIYEVSESMITRVYFKGESYEPVNLLAKGFNSNDNTIFLKEPLQVGKEWTTGNGQRRIIQTDARLQTPAGNFSNCIKVEISEKNSSAVSYEYYARNVGLIKREFIDSGTIISSILQKHQIN